VWLSTEANDPISRHCLFHVQKEQQSATAPLLLLLSVLGTTFHQLSPVHSHSEMNLKLNFSVTASTANLVFLFLTVLFKFTM